jgi:hypothetical protein
LLICASPRVRASDSAADKRGNPIIFDLPRQRDLRPSRPFGHSLQQSGMTFDVRAYFSRFAPPRALRFSHRCGARIRQYG